MLLFAALAAHAEPVCSTCTYTEIRQALEAGFSAIELTDARAYSGFLHDFEHLGLVTITDPSGGARIQGATDGAILVAEGAQLRVEGVPLASSGGASIVSIKGAGSLLELDDVVLDCDDRNAALGGAANLESGALLRMTGGEITACAASDGGAIWAAESTVELSQGVELRDNGAGNRGGALYLDDSEATLTDVLIEGNSANQGGGVYASGSSVTLGGTTRLADNIATAGGAMKLSSSSTWSVEPGSSVKLERNEAATGGAVVLEGASAPAPLEGLTFDDNRATLDGGAVWFSGTSLELVSTTFRRNRAGGYGGSVAALVGERLTITGGTFRDDEAMFGGAVFADTVSTVTITDTSFEESFATFAGGALEIIGGRSVTVTDTTFDHTRSQEIGGAADFFLAEGVTLKRNLYCSPRALSGGALSFSGSCFSERCVVENERVHDAGAEIGGALYAELGSRVDASHLTVVAPVPMQGGSVCAVLDPTSSLTLRKSVVHGARDAVFSGQGVVLDQVNVDVSDGASVPASLGATTEETFLLGSADPSTLPCGGVEFRLHPDSPLVGLGAYEGPSRDERFWDTDSDEDSVPLAYDCADEGSPTVGGLLPERCDNGVDDDCDGVIDEDDAIPTEPWWPDPDGDGYAASDAKAGTTCEVPRDAITDPTRLLDCGEGDPERFPGAAEVADDGIDQDCDGQDARSFVAGGGGCGCHSGGGAAPLWVLVALLSRTRRGSSRSRA